MMLRRVTTFPPSRPAAVYRAVRPNSLRCLPLHPKPCRYHQRTLSRQSLILSRTATETEPQHSSSNRVPRPTEAHRASSAPRPRSARSPATGRSHTPPRSTASASARYSNTVNNRAPYHRPTRSGQRSRSSPPPAQRIGISRRSSPIRRGACPHVLRGHSISSRRISCSRRGSRLVRGSARQTSSSTPSSRRWPRNPRRVTSGRGRKGPSGKQASSTARDHERRPAPLPTAATRSPRHRSRRRSPPRTPTRTSARP